MQHAAGRLGRARVPGRSQGTQAVYRSSLGVRFGAHYGLKSDIALSPKSANGGRPYLVFVRTVRQVLGTRKPTGLYGIPIF